MIAAAMARGREQPGPQGVPWKVVSPRQGSISLAEDFARPLVIGYLGFDMAIGPGRVLRPPIPTHTVLEARRESALRGTSACGSPRPQP